METIQSKALGAKTASGTAEGSSMEKVTPKVGDAPSKTNDGQSVPANANFGLKKLAFKKCTSGY